MQEQKLYTINEALLTALLAYMQEQPYKEVAQLITALAKSPLVEQLNKEQNAN